MMAMMLKYAKPQTVSVREKRMGVECSIKGVLIEKLLCSKEAVD